MNQTLQKYVPSFWLGFSLIAFLEFVFFRTHVLKNISFLYPTNFDQSSYLPLSYRTFENIKQFGFWMGVKKSEHLATGLLFPIQAAFFYSLFGASRLVALLPNFIYYILLQVFAVIAVRSINNKPYHAFTLLGLILLINTPFLITGGLMDFRIDFMAFCLYGMILCAAVRSHFFLNTQWTIHTCVFAIFLILLRGLTLVYLLAILGLTLMYVFYLYKKTYITDPAYPDLKKRLKHLFIITLIIGSIALLYIWLNRAVLFNYYMIGHLLGAEKNIRASEVGVTNFTSLLLFYPNSLFNVHLGVMFVNCSVLLLSFFFLRPQTMQKNSQQLMLTLKPLFLKTPVQNPTLWKIGFVFLTTSFLIPLMVLTADINKSGVVGSIMVMPVIWLIQWMILFLDSSYDKSKLVQQFLFVFSLMIFTIGLAHQIHQFSHHKSKSQYRNLSGITKMYEDIGDYAVAHGWKEINLSIDQVCDYLTSGGIETLYYESRKKLVTVGIEHMGGEIFAIPETEALLSMKRSNVVILNLNDYPAGSPYPFNQSISAMRPELKNFAEANFQRLGDYQFMNSTFRVYVVS